MNNLRELRKARRWTQQEAADLIGTAPGQYAKLERGERRLNEFWINRAALAFRVNPGEIVSSPIEDTPVLGSIGSGGVVRWIGGIPPRSETRGALTVGTGVLGLAFVGTRLMTACRRVRQNEMVEGRPYLVYSKQWLLRLVHTAREQKWHLFGCDVSPQFDAAVDEAILCDLIYWP